MSGRLLCNLIYVHLRNRQEHAEKCTEDKCVPACGYVRLEQWLDSPVTVYDRRRDQQQRDRLQALMRGEVSA